MKKLVIGICAHVDAGKTTLSESLLYLSGAIRKMGRVDNKDAHLDNFELERARGITIFSKQAMLEVGDVQITLVDTPGHVDFSLEMERTLQVLDYAILVINGADGIQGHTKTLWRLLAIYQIPVFLFINKMDQVGTDKEKIMNELKQQFSDGCIEFGQTEADDFYDQLAMSDEILLESYVDRGQIEIPQIIEAVRKRKVYPCFFGSALKLEGVEGLMQGMVNYAHIPSYPEAFGAKLFKIGRDEQGNRLTYMKITGGRLKVRDSLSNGVWEEKVNQIRIYSGKKFEAVNEVEAGSVCAVTGLTQTKPGEGLGIEAASHAPLLEPVLAYQILLPEGCDPRVMLPKLRQLEEEDPGLHMVWDEQLSEIQVQIMGEVQLEILQSLIQSRFGIEVSFGSGRIVYKETIGGVVEGVGHFEPLRHYAEVHLLMEPGERGSGLQFGVECSEDVLGKSWQRLILSHLEEKVHKGVLTGAPITDMKITLVSGRAHTKHTDGGDFREATYRAVRQGLKSAESILLEPYYSFHLELPEKMVGRAMTDLEKMHGTCQITHIEGNIAVLTGSAPVLTMRNYHKEVMAYTKGLGRLFCSLKGYEPCHNPEEVIEKAGYDSERDVDNPTGSVFCAHGSGFLVPWDEVKDYMHVESYFQKEHELFEEGPYVQASYSEERWIDPEEIDRILNQTYYANQGKKSVWQKRKTAAESYYRPTADLHKFKELKEDYLLVDGYNIIFAWPELKELVKDNMDGARMRLLDTLSNYQGIRKCRIMVVFDAYRVQGHPEEVVDYDTIRIVYTKEAQTADQYIERFAYDHQKKFNIAVATSDGLQQIIIRGAGCALLSAKDLKEEIEMANESVRQAYQAKQTETRNYLKDALSAKTEQQIKELLKEEKE
ncbi:small GTP-binding protein domain protein [Desulfitobacterium dehalogenans ATCC 51507]|uniref:Small GTP-binding protein domain protein n=1 Tax=Desulfitobacterium dehalogenans (strain ATCC 51507 / DSM 9161 / JW/IU-DC1) TaxID=756499 RepID=I4A884_DESDJ|nr:TetM/TetW/TetO/TetS family tetracycline resistance ribosomal protection protein [Desulfitobacterium dehalogenans]AFM00169.1 small GTP-binding protein domain protein [Desulfitobacterium dehalogenans ATCC 51507]